MPRRPSKSSRVRPVAQYGNREVRSTTGWRAYCEWVNGSSTLAACRLPHPPRVLSNNRIDRKFWLRAVAPPIKRAPREHCLTLDRKRYEAAMEFKRVADSLMALRRQVNEMAPGRDTSSDGTLGDEAHRNRKSDHNPDADGVVTAMDITHDPAHGVDAGVIAEMLRVSQDPRIKYVISNRRIFSSKMVPWQWRPYDGANAHTK